MDIEFKGGNCVVISAKKTTIVVDPNLSSIGLKDQGEKATVQLLTQAAFATAAAEGTLVIDGPGEYEVDNISIKGVAAQAHMDPKGDVKKATIYRVNAGDLSVVIVGHVHPSLTEEQLEALGVVDVVVVPVGGNGYTLDATGAVQVVRAIDPKVVIPTHYAEPGVSYEVPQATVEGFMKEIGVSQEETSKLKLKAGTLNESLVAQVIKRTA